MSENAEVRILVVDDEEEVATLWTESLRRAGFDAIGAQDSSTALEIAERFRPHIALLDIGLPGMDGHELGRRLRALDPNLALVAVTGDDTLRTADRSDELGFAAHLIKPVRLGDLRRMVKLMIITRSMTAS